MTLQLIGSPTSVLIAFILEAVNRILNIVFAFVPAMVGVDEAGTGLLANVLGLGTTAGITLAIVRKARMLVWIGSVVFDYAANQITQTRPSVNSESRSDPDSAGSGNSACRPRAPYNRGRWRIWRVSNHRPRVATGFSCCDAASGLEIPRLGDILDTCIARV